MEGGYKTDSLVVNIWDNNQRAGLQEIADNLFPDMPEQSLMSASDPDVLFQSNLVGMMLQGSWMAGLFYQFQQEGDAEYGRAEIPYYDANGNGTCEKEERVSLYDGLGWAANAKTKDPQAAYDLIAAFRSEEGQRKQTALGVTIVAYKGCSDAFINSFEGMDLSP